MTHLDPKQQWDRERAERQRLGRAIAERLEKPFNAHPAEARRVAENIGALFEELKTEGISRKQILEHLVQIGWAGDESYAGSRLRTYVKVPRKNARAGNKTNYVRDLSRQARIVNACLDVAGSHRDKEETYLRVFGDVSSLKAAVEAQPARRLEAFADHEDFITAVERSLPPILDDFDLAGYFREVTRYALTSLSLTLPWRTPELRPCDAAVDHPWMSDARGRVTEGYLPMAGSVGTRSVSYLEIGAIPSIPLCWLPFQGEHYTCGRLTYLDLDPSTLGYRRIADARSRDAFKCRERSIGAIELCDAAEVRLAVGPVSDDGQPRLMFEVLLRSIIRATTEHQTFILPGFSSDEARRDSFGIEGRDNEYLGVELNGHEPVCALIELESDAQPLVWTPTESALARLVREVEGVHYLAFDAANLVDLLVHSCSGDQGFVMAWELSPRPYPLFSSHTAAALFQSALIHDEEIGSSPVQRALSAQLEAYTAALSIFQLRCRDDIKKIGG